MRLWPVLELGAMYYYLMSLCTYFKVEERDYAWTYDRLQKEIYQGWVLTPLYWFYFSVCLLCQDLMLEWEDHQRRSQASLDYLTITIFKDLSNLGNKPWANWLLELICQYCRCFLPMLIQLCKFFWNQKTLPFQCIVEYQNKHTLFYLVRCWLGHHLKKNLI